MERLEILLVEANLLDVQEIEAKLRMGGIDYELLQIDTKTNFIKALETKAFDLILSNYILPGFDGLWALEAARNLHPETPFIFVSVSVGEELVIEALENGAAGFVLKHRLERLVPCVQRVLQETRQRKHHQQVEQALRESETDFHAMFKVSNVGIVQSDAVTRRFLRVNAAFCAITGYTESELLTLAIDDINHPDEREHDQDYYTSLLCGEVADYQSEKRYLRKDGTVVWVLVTGNIIHDEYGKPLRKIAVVQDITDRKRSEQVLSENERLLRLALASAQAGSWDWEIPTGKVFWSPENYVLYGLDPAKGAPVYDDWYNAIHPDDREKTNGEVWRLIEQRLPEFRCEFRIVDPHRGIRWLLGLGSLSFNEQGEPIRLSGINLDITDRKQAEQALHESSERLALAIDGTKMGVWDWNIATNEVIWTPYHEILFGYEPGTPNRSYQEWADRVHPEDLSRAETALQTAMAEHKDYQCEYRVIWPDGSLHWLSALGRYTYEQDQPVRMLGILFDITDRVQNEYEREQILQRERAARAEADRANQIKDEFLAVLSHELRSPLNPILGWIHLLQTRKLDETRQREALLTIERNARLQTQLIEDLLDISCVMRGKLTLTTATVSLTFVILAAVETVRTAAQAKNIQILLDLDSQVAPILGDATRLQQVVWNLLSNAVKFTHSGGKVTVELRQVGQFAEMRVIDTGKGINPEFLPYVFEYFRQQDRSTTRKFGGLGLGLAIVRQIVEMHGGTVTAESEGENQGAVFTVQIPIVEQVISTTYQPVRTSVDIENSLTNLKILVVDDDDDTRNFQVFVLEQSGAIVTSVTSGFDALQVLDRFIPDLMISDVGMPEMDGYMLIKQIRSRQLHQGGQIPVLALTAYAAEVDQQKALQAGFQAHLTKPVEPEELVRTVVRLLKSK